MALPLKDIDIAATLSYCLELTAEDLIGIEPDRPPARAARLFRVELAFPHWRDRDPRYLPNASSAAAVLARTHR
jgi:hypothetical protein